MQSIESLNQTSMNVKEDKQGTFCVTKDTNFIIFPKTGNGYQRCQDEGLVEKITAELKKNGLDGVYDKKTNIGTWKYKQYGITLKSGKIYCASGKSKTTGGHSGVFVSGIPKSGPGYSEKDVKNMILEAVNYMGYGLVPTSNPIDWKRKCTKV